MIVARHPREYASAAVVIAAGERPITTTWGGGTLGSRYTPSAPSLSQANGTVVTPERNTPSSSSDGPRNSSRGWPSAIAARASRMTVGSAHAPDSQPRTEPSGMMTAFEPCFPDAGPRRHTTVASTNVRPRRSRSPASSSTPAVIPLPLPRLRLLHRRPHTRRGHGHVDVAHAVRQERVDLRVHVRRVRDHGRGLADAFGADRVVRRRIDRVVELEARRLPRHGDGVVGEARSDAVAVLVEGDVLH